MNIIYVTIFTLLIFYISYKLCDIYPGSTPNGKRDTFCKNPIFSVFLFILIILYFYFFTKRK